MDTDRPVRFGVLGTARIAVNKVIPAMRGGDLTEVVAIASRDQGRADATAHTLGLARAYGSYEALLDDPDIDAIYNPLPNHLHVPWSIEAARRGKHVLCEKPIGLSSLEAQSLIDARDRHGVLIQEAFMVWTHPQWRRPWTSAVRAGWARCSLTLASSPLSTMIPPTSAMLRSTAGAR